jgi:hypothetical protein
VINFQVNYDSFVRLLRQGPSSDVVLGIDLTQPPSNLIQREPRARRGNFNQLMVQHSTNRALEDQERGGKANSQQHESGYESYPAMEDENEFAGVHIEIDVLADALFRFF